MDRDTLSVYNANSEAFVRQYESMVPTALYDFIKRYFQPQGATAEIGCGSGRDAAWLVSQGYAVQAYDASPAMLAEGRRLHPELQLASATLPDLVSVPRAAYSNVLCAAVLMHLDRTLIQPSMAALLSLLQPSGHLIISVRGSRSSSIREVDGRLFTSLSIEDIHVAASTAGGRVIADEIQSDSMRLDINWLMVAIEAGS